MGVPWLKSSHEPQRRSMSSALAPYENILCTLGCATQSAICVHSMRSTVCPPELERLPATYVPMSLDSGFTSSACLRLPAISVSSESPRSTTNVHPTCWMSRQKGSHITSSEPRPASSASGCVNLAKPMSAQSISVLAMAADSDALSAPKSASVPVLLAAAVALAPLSSKSLMACKSAANCSSSPVSRPASGSALSILPAKYMSQCSLRSF